MVKDLINISVIIVVGYLAAQIGLKAKIPMSGFIAPIIAIGALQTIGLNIIAPAYLKATISVILGCFFGLFFNKEVLEKMKQLIMPCLFLIVSNIILTFFNGYVLTSNTAVGKATAFFSVVPGGIAEMTIVALSYPTDLVQITTFQMARLLAVVLVVPPLILNFFLPKLSPKNSVPAPILPEPVSDKPLKKGKLVEKHWGLYLLIGSLGSLVFYYLKIPSAFLLGSLVGVIIFNITKKENWNVQNLPKSLNDYSRIIMGGIIGSSFTQDSLRQIGQLFLPVVVITLLIIGGGILIAWLISKIYKMDFLTCLMASIPGGILPMILMAEELNADVAVVSTLQIVRLLTAVLVIPLIFSFIL